MSHDDVALKAIPSVRVAELTAVAGSYTSADIGPVISPLYPRLMAALDTAGVTPSGPAVAYYEPEPDGRIVVHAGIIVRSDQRASDDFAVVDLPPVETAATIVHHGPMSEVMPTMNALLSWLQDHGYEQLAWAREVYLDYSPEDAANGVTELQVAVRIP